MTSFLLRKNKKTVVVINDQPVIKCDISQQMKKYSYSNQKKMIINNLSEKNDKINFKENLKYKEYLLTDFIINENIH